MRSLTRTCSFGVVIAIAAMAVIGLSGSRSAFAACTGPGAPTDTETRCLTAVQIPGNPLRSFDISWVNPDRAEYYLGDRSNAGIDIIDTQKNTFKRRLPGFTGAVLNSAGTAVNNAVSGPDGVTSHGRWVYGGDGDSTLKVFDLLAQTVSPPTQTVPTGGKFRVDEMALMTDGTLLLAANNADDPPFATLFQANGDRPVSSVAILSKIVVSSTIIPPTFGLSIEQPAWDPTTARFYVSIPVIANNPAGCNFGQLPGAITCDGGLLVVNPATLSSGVNTIGAFDPTTNTGVVPLHRCGPNGATLGPNEAGPLSQWLVNALTEADLPVICVETRHMKALLTAQQINKTDRNDARGIAQIQRHLVSRATLRAFRAEAAAHWQDAVAAV